MLSEGQSKYRVIERMELHERVSMMNENKNPKEERLMGRREGQGRLNIHSMAVAIVGEEGWVGKRDDNFSWC